MIKLFNATDKLYETHGDLVLNPTKAVVHKEDNGAFYLDIETPIIENETKNVEAEQGQTATGTNLTLEIDTTKQNEIQSIEGNLSQEGTPTPTNPIPIEVVSGRQEVSVVGKNLWNENTQIFTNQSRFSNPTKDSNNVWTFTISGSNGYAFATSNITLQAGTYYASATVDNGNFIILKGDATQTIPFTLTEETEITFRVYKNGNVGDVVKLSNVMLEKGSSATTYEEYKGQSYEINLGKNLYKDGTTYTPTTIAWRDQNGNLLNGTSDFQSNTNYINLIANQPYTFSVKDKTNIAQAQCVYINNGSVSLLSNISLTSATTFTPTSNLKVWIRTKNTASATDTLFTGQLEKGSIATSYTPYKTPIYLGKIGNYKDYIFRNTTENPLYDSTLEEGQWYIHKEIERLVLTGASSESWHFANQTTYMRNYIDIDNVEISTPNTSVAPLLSNYFSAGTYNSHTVNTITGRNGIAQINFFHNIATSNADWKTWLGTHNLEVYYVLNTPTTSLLDDELQEELNSIQFLEGLNNISVSSPYLSGILSVHYNFKTAYSNAIRYIDYLIPNNIIVANTPQGDQAFRITNIEKTRRKIKIKANHVFYDTNNYLIADSYVVDKNCNDALDHLNSATSDLSPFTTISNITNINSYRCVRKSLFEAIQVVLERWGGHLVRDNWTIGINDEIGQDNGVTIRYAKNLKDISATYEWDAVVTKLLPVGKDGILLNEVDPDTSLYVESVVQYDIPYTKTVSFEQNEIEEDNYKDDDGNLDEEAYKTALVNDLYLKATSYVSENSTPKVNYSLAANVEKISDVGDRIEVIDEKLGINLMTSIISYDYDCLLNKYTNLEFGNFLPQLSNLISNVESVAERVAQEQNSTLAVTLGRELNEATSKIWNALGNSYVIYDGDKILIVDSLPKETATNVIMLNNGGIGFSNTGINGTFSSAWTIDNVLNMEQINVINLTADLIKGGTLKLGSNLNQNGQIEVYDEANNLISELNKDGLKMYGVDGSYVLMNNTVGFAGFDRLGNKIYWVDQDEFHMKKSVVEEEITLVSKMRIIPITIRDTNDNIVNDGIGFVNVGGGN